MIFGPVTCTAIAFSPRVHPVELVHFKFRNRSKTNEYYSSSNRPTLLGMFTASSESPSPRNDHHTRQHPHTPSRSLGPKVRTPHWGDSVDSVRFESKETSSTESDSRAKRLRWLGLIRKRRDSIHWIRFESERIPSTGFKSEETSSAGSERDCASPSDSPPIHSIFVAHFRCLSSNLSLSIWKFNLPLSKFGFLSPKQPKSGGGSSGQQIWLDLARTAKLPRTDSQHSVTECGLAKTFCILLQGSPVCFSGIWEAKGMSRHAYASKVLPGHLTCGLSRTLEISCNRNDFEFQIPNLD